MSERRACAVVGAYRNMRYRSYRDDDRYLQSCLRQLARSRVVGSAIKAYNSYPPGWYHDQLQEDVASVLERESWCLTRKNEGVPCAAEHRSLGCAATQPGA